MTLSDPHKITEGSRHFLDGVCGVSGIERLWVLLSHVSFYANAFYYSVAWFFCLLYLTGAVAGFFLLRSARWAQTLVGCISISIVLATIVALSVGIALPAAYCVVGVFAAVSLVLLLLLTSVEPAA